MTVIGAVAVRVFSKGITSERLVLQVFFTPAQVACGKKQALSDGKYARPAIAGRERAEATEEIAVANVNARRVDDRSFMSDLSLEPVAKIRRRDQHDSEHPSQRHLVAVFNPSARSSGKTPARIFCARAQLPHARGVSLPRRKGPPTPFDPGHQRSNRRLARLAPASMRGCSAGIDRLAGAATLAVTAVSGPVVASLHMSDAFRQRVEVRWADLDPNGHVRHSVYYDWAALARIAYLQRQGVGVGWMATNAVGPVLFREEARFLREVRLGDEMDVDFRVAGLSDDGRKWRIRHGITRSGNELVATVELDGAWIDLRARKVRVPPDQLTRALGDLPRTDDFVVL